MFHKSRRDLNEKKQICGHYVVLCVDAQNRQFLVKLDHQIIKRLPIKGLHNQQLPLQDYVNLIRKEALSE